jgi:hypothetical protein
MRVADGHDIVAAALEHLADDHLRFATGAHVGGVVEVIPASSTR